MRSHLVALIEFSNEAMIPSALCQFYISGRRVPPLLIHPSDPEQEITFFIKRFVEGLGIELGHAYLVRQVTGGKLL